jgi:HSP20 family protein
VLVREVRYGSFRREFALPEGVTADAVEASYDAGILEVRVHGVAREVETAKRIPVTAAAAAAIESPAAEQEPAPESAADTEDSASA